MGRAVKRKQASSKLEIKRNNGMSSGIFKCSLPFIYIYFLTVFPTSSAVYVQWEAKFPVIFGNVTYLQCSISDMASNCANKDRQWIGGPHYDGLCYENECPTFKKYQVMKQPRCLYTLMIYNFSESDVNCEYTCLYGASKMRQNLTIDKKKFIYVPYKRDITQEYMNKVQDNIFSWRINVEKIYPEPSCVADFNGKNITNGMNISVTKPGFYFATELQIIHSLSSCGNICVSCFLGEHKINIASRDFNNCQGGTNRNIVIIMLALVLVATTCSTTIVVFCVIIYRRKQRKDPDLIDHEELESSENKREDTKKKRKPTVVVRPQPSRPHPSMHRTYLRTDNSVRAEYSNALPSIGQASDSPRPLPQKPPGYQLDHLSDSTSEKKKKKKNRKKKEAKQSDEEN